MNKAAATRLTRLVMMSWTPDRGERSRFVPEEAPQPGWEVGVCGECVTSERPSLTAFFHRF